MSEPFELEIIKQDSSEKIPVDWIEVESPSGNFVVGPDHSEVISLLKYRGKLKYKQHGGTEIEIDTYSGLFKFEKNRATILI